MNSLKRTLSLVLVLVMVLGLFGIAGAAYTDEAKIQYKEAVNVMTGIGAIEGDAGAFNPAGNLTRAAAAKMVAYTVLGADIAKNLPVKVSSFKDVNANFAWAIPSIEYLVSKGVIEGYNKDTFGPNDPVTGNQLAKMLLVALGSKADFSSNSWELNTAIEARNYGIFENTKATDFSKAATREEAALYCFNSLFYSKTGASSEQIYGITGWKDVDGTLVPVYGWIKVPTVAAGSIAATVYPTLKKVAAEGDKDVFGRPAARTWSYKGKTISTVYSQAPVKTYNTPVTESAIYNDLSGTGASISVTVYTNGVAAGNTTTLTAEKNDLTNTLGGYGQTTELYRIVAENGAVSYRAVVITNFMAKVTAVTPYKAATATTLEQKASITATVKTVDGTTFARKDIEGLTFETTGFVKGDVIYVTMADGVLQSAAKATAVDGKMTAYGAGYIVANGQKVPVCAAAQNMSAEVAKASIMGFTAGVPASAGCLNFTDTYTVYLDNNMAIVGAQVKEAAVSTNYAFIVKAEYRAADTSILGATGNAAKAQVVFSDGSKAIVDMAITNTGTTAAPVYKVNAPLADGTAEPAVLAAALNTAAANIGNWFAYVKNTDGTYTFTAVSATYATVKTDGVTLAAKTTTAIGGKYTTSATVITSVDTNGVKTTITGFPTTALTISGKLLYTYASGSNVITGIYAVAQAPIVASVTYAYAVKAGNTTSAGQEWVFAVNGEQVTYVISGTAPVAGNVYALSSAANNTYTVGASIIDTTAVANRKVVAVADTTLFVTDEAFVYGTGAGVYNVGTAATTVGMKDTVSKGDTVVVISAAGSPKTALAVYIVKDAD